MQEIKKWWKKVKLWDIIEIFDNKRIPLSTIQRSKKQGNYPYYWASWIIDYIDDFIFDWRYLLISEDWANLTERKTSIAFFAEWKFWVNNHSHIILWKPNIADSDFIMYWFSWNNIWWYITWAAQPKLSQSSLSRIEILLPPLPTQQKIASILSKYDDLIENNNKRIKILEETAQSIYEEWFVKYNFPWSENIKMVDSGNDDFGMIPEGWEIKKVEEISLIVSKWPSLNYVNDENQWIPVINQKCIRNWEIELNTIQFAEKLKDDKSYCYLEKYDILINSMWTWTLWRVSRNLTIDEKYIIHNCISFVRSNQNKLKQTVLYYQIKSKENHFISLSTWSTWQTN